MEQVWQRCKRARWINFITVFLLFIVPTVQSLLSLFTCYNVGDELLLYADMEVDCRASSHTMWQWLLGVPGLLFYCVFVPAGSVYYMWQFRGDILSARGKIRAKQALSEEEVRAMWRFGFLVNGMNPNAFYWQIVIMVRKICVVIAAVEAKPMGVHIQIVAMFMVSRRYITVATI